MSLTRAPDAVSCSLLLPLLQSSLPVGLGCSFVAASGFACSLAFDPSVCLPVSVVCSEFRGKTGGWGTTGFRVSNVVFDDDAAETFLGSPFLVCVFVRS